MFRSFGAVSLPRPLSRHVDELVLAFLRPEAGREFDFCRPVGEPALIPAGSVSWRVFKNPIAVFIGGVAAVLLELAEPRVRDAVWQFSNFRTDPLTRLKRTGLAAMITIYGARSKAEAMIAGVVSMHARVRGRTTDGEPYAADDPALLDWVQATVNFGFLEAYQGYGRALAAHEREAYFRDLRPVGLLYGAAGTPGSESELDALFEGMRGRLVASPIIFEFLEIMGRIPVFPGPGRTLQPMFLKAAVAILPGWVRDRLALDARYSLRRWERTLVVSAVAAGDRIVIPSSPAVQACRRLGLPADYLYRRDRLAAAVTG
jgi:uncharacterized protein (DUF2236 family)